MNNLKLLDKYEKINQIYTSHMEKYLVQKINKLEIMLQFKKLINQNLKMKTNICQ